MNSNIIARVICKPPKESDLNRNVAAVREGRSLAVLCGVFAARRLQQVKQCGDGVSALGQSVLHEGESAYLHRMVRYIASVMPTKFLEFCLQ